VAKIILDKDGWRRINVSKGKMNFSQRNNAIMPLATCQVTSMVMGLSYLGWEFPEGKYKQPEDNLEAYFLAQGKNHEIHANLAEYTNRWLGKAAVSFSTQRMLSQIVNELVEGRPVIMSGQFPGFPTRRIKPLGHVVCLAGCEWQPAHAENPVANPDFFIIDDPYGNTLNDWNGSGNDIKLDAETFYSWLKPEKNRGIKWGHFLKRPADAADWVASSEKEPA
jgi:hypothetical protein